MKKNDFVLWKINDKINHIQWIDKTRAFLGTWLGEYGGRIGRFKFNFVKIVNWSSKNGTGVNSVNEEYLVC